jgi:hypothetical protein
MSDGSQNAIPHIMKVEKKGVTEDEAEEKDAEGTGSEDESEDEESEEEEAEEESEDESDDDESDDSSSKKEELDLDAELEKEREAGKPDLTIAEKAFKERKDKREAPADDEDAEKPLTQKDLDAALAADRKERQHDDALVIAKGMAGSDKEAELIVAKWANRTFPKSLTLREQINEAYVITHGKKLIAERNEAMRALKGKEGVNRNAAGSHKDGTKNPNEPKLPPADAAAIRASGFVWNTATRQYEKKLPNGSTLIRDSKTKQVRLIRKK